MAVVFFKRLFMDGLANNVIVVTYSTIRGCFLSQIQQLYLWNHVSELVLNPLKKGKKDEHDWLVTMQHGLTKELFV